MCIQLLAGLDNTPKTILSARISSFTHWTGAGVFKNEASKVPFDNIRNFHT